MSINYSEKIPNNVNLAEDRKLQRALEHWQPAFIDWWKELGPEGFQANEDYLRTATGVDAKGWASYGYTEMPDYRWGIFLADKTEDRTVGFGDEFGKPVWQEVPGEHRSALRRLIVTQGDTEPASVEQQRLLGQTAPSMYDLRNLLQINVEEGRHLWAMVYLLHGFFGRDGREEAEAMLERHSGDEDNPRILGTFNEPQEEWLSFFTFAYFTDRDGKFQLKSLAESAFDPLSRTCQFMLTEEAHHMFVGETGLGRVIQRTSEVMQELKTDDPARLREHGVIDFGIIQRYINFWFTSSLDLFGTESSSNAANSFAAGLKGRPDEDMYEDHDCSDDTFSLERPHADNGKVITEDIPMRNAMNLVTRNAYIKDCETGLKRWNRQLSKAGVDFTFTLPSDRFHRAIGVWAGFHFGPDGKSMSKTEWESRLYEWVPSREDRDFVKSLMKPVYEPGKIAGWIAPPARGINNNPVDYEYVKL